MIIDTSALVALLLAEPESSRKLTGEPVLLKGNDFSRTDIAVVLPGAAP